MLVLAGLLTGERLEHLPTLPALLAVAYLVVVGGILVYLAYSYLLARVSPALATIYAYVNPLVALLLGVGLAGERLASGRCSRCPLSLPWWRVGARLSLMARTTAPLTISRPVVIITR